MTSLLSILMLGWVAVLVCRNVLAQQSSDALNDWDGRENRPRPIPEDTEPGTAARRRFASYLLRSRKPFLPAEDRPPLASRITFSSVEDYVADGMQGITILLMQASRRPG